MPFFCMPVIPALRKQRLEHQKFKVIFGYIMSRILSWLTWDATSKKQKRNAFPFPSLWITRSSMVFWWAVMALRAGRPRFGKSNYEIYHPCLKEESPVPPVDIQMPFWGCANVISVGNISHWNHCWQPEKWGILCSTTSHGDRECRTVHT